MHRRPGLLAGLLALALLAGACSFGRARPGTLDPAGSVPANPDYTQACSPSGRDVSLTCIQVELQAIDNARIKEHVKAMALPAGFDKLSDSQQMLVVVNRERVDRGLPPFVGLTTALNADAQEGAAASRLPRDPGASYTSADTEWIGDVANALDADYLWLYEGGPGSQGCPSAGAKGCWSDRHIVLDRFGTRGTLVMGAALDPTADTSSGDVGGTSLAVTLAVASRPGSLDYSWAQALADIALGTIRPRGAPPSDASATHIADPPKTVPAAPDFTQVCASSGLDSSPPCLAAVLQAVNAARAQEGVKPMALPADFGALTVPEQILVATNLERVDRGLRPFSGLTPELNRNAQQGADQANDPPDPGDTYTVADTEWAGGSSNGLDADYGWMYDDGIGSGNLDCPKRGGEGCWGHRHGVLDDFGTVGTMVMGAALNATADTGDDKGGPSMAATLAVTSQDVGPLAYTWTPSP